MWCEKTVDAVIGREREDESGSQMQKISRVALSISLGFEISNGMELVDFRDIFGTRKYRHNIERYHFHHDLRFALFDIVPILHEI
jgi:hypothetical protein